MKKSLPIILGLTVLITGNLLAQNSDYNNGEIGIWVGSYGDLEVTNGVDSSIVDRISVLVAGATNQVYDYWNDIDVEEEWTELETPTLGSYESTITLNNAYSGEPPDVKVKQNHFMWESGGYSLLRYEVVNNESASLSARLGIEIVPQINYYQDTGNGEKYLENIIDYYSDTKIAVFTTEDSTEQVGFKFLNIDMARIQSLDDYTDYTKSDDQYYTLMTTPGFNVPDTATGTDPALVTVLSTGSQSISSGAGKVLYIGVAVGGDSTEMVNNMLALQDTAYLDVITENNKLWPESHSLEQNYPNPFNPATTIGFYLAQEDQVELRVYNILGEQVALLKNGVFTKGYHSITFNAADQPSGIYFYMLKTSASTITKKMILLK